MEVSNQLNAVPICVDLDMYRSKILEAAETGDFAGCRRIVEDIFGRRYHGCIPLHADYVPAECPIAALPETGCYVKGKPWTATFTRAYKPGYYVVVGRNPSQRAPSPPDASRDLRVTEWRNASGKQPAPPGFEKKNASSDYPIGAETYSMKAVVFYRNSLDAHSRWNAGQPIIQVLHISVKEARLAPRRDSETAYSAQPPYTPSTPPAAAPLARASDGDEENGDYANVAEL